MATCTVFSWFSLQSSIMNWGTATLKHKTHSPCYVSTCVCLRIQTVYVCMCRSASISQTAVHTSVYHSYKILNCPASVLLTLIILYIIIVLLSLYRRLGNISCMYIIHVHVLHKSRCTGTTHVCIVCSGCCSTGDSGCSRSTVCSMSGEN